MFLASILITVVNLAGIWFWLCRAREVRDEASFLRASAEAEQKAAKEWWARFRSDAELTGECVPPGVYPFFVEPFVGVEALKVCDWERMKDFPCRKFREGDDRRIIGFVVGRCEGKVEFNSCPRLQHVRELYLCGAHAAGLDKRPPVGKKDAGAADGRGDASEVRDFDNEATRRGLVLRPASDEQTGAPGNAVAPEVDGSEHEAADGGNGSDDLNCGVHAADSTAANGARQGAADPDKLSPLAKEEEK